MNLADIVTNNRIVNNTQIAANSALNNEGQVSLKSDALSELISDLKPGDNVSAQIVSKDGNTVSLVLPGGTPFDAKLSGNIGLDIGKLITFEVKSNGSKLLLSPLFTNMATDPSVNKALDNAGIPLNNDSVMMTKELMQNGLPVNRDVLNAVYKEVLNFPDSSVSDIVDLHKLGLEVNEENLTQIENYKNLSYQLDSGLTDSLKSTGELLNELTSKDDISFASKVFGSLLEIATEDTEAAPKLPVLESETIVPEAKENVSAADKALMLLRGISEENITSKENLPNKQDALTDIKIDSFENKSPEEIKNALVDNLKEFVDASDINSKTTSELINITKQIFESAITDKDENKLARLLGNDDIRDAVLAQVKEKWSISPEGASDKESVKELYQRLTRQLNELSSTLESIGQKESPAANSLNNMSSNIDFLNQINQMYAYVQLPLKLSGGENTHGDLYVYTNGKKLNSNDGKVTALLHLDMEHLGPLDVYVALDRTGGGNKVSTNFTVADDSILDFLNDHMDELTKRLEAKGYNISSKLMVKGDSNASDEEINPAGGGINPVLSMAGKVVKVAEYSFDVRT